MASGDPLADRVILWTRLTTTATTPQPLGWVVARDPDLRDVVASGTVMAAPADDWCVHVDAGGLPAATTLHYRFTSSADASPTGRTRTAAPPGTALAGLRLAVASCSNHEAGYFTAYGRIAARDDLDLVVHLGDYLYETAGARGPAGRGHQPPRTLRTLADYRTRYAQYRSDPDLQRAHQQHPWAVVWDDHETANDAWTGGARGHDEARDGPFAARKAAATRAWREWQPVRLPDPARPGRIYRSLDFGDLARLVLLDTRLEGRDRQETDAALAAAPGRSLLGAAQRTWLEDRLGAPGARWKVLGNQVMLSPHTFGDIPPSAAASVGLDPATAGKSGDDWGGYPEERRRLIALLRRLQADVVVVTGDFHSSWGADIVEDPSSPDPPVGVELVGTSTTSLNLGERLDRSTLQLANAFVQGSNPNVRHVDLGGHGYLLLDIRPQRVRGEWWVVDTIASPTSGESLAQAAEVAAGARTLVLADLAPATAPPATVAAPPAPPAPSTTRGTGGGYRTYRLPVPLLPIGVGAAALLGGAAAAMGLRRRR